MPRSSRRRSAGLLVLFFVLTPCASAELPLLIAKEFLPGIRSDQQAFQLTGLLAASSGAFRTLKRKEIQGAFEEMLERKVVLQGEALRPPCLEDFLRGTYQDQSSRIHSLGSPIFESEDERKVAADAYLRECWFSPDLCWAAVVRLDYSELQQLKELLYWLASGTAKLTIEPTGSATLLLILPPTCTMEDALLHIGPQVLDLGNNRTEDYLIVRAALVEVRPGAFESPRLHYNLSRWIPGKLWPYPEEAVDGFGRACGWAAVASSEEKGSGGYRFHEIFGRVLCSPSVYSDPQDFTGAAAGLKIFVQPLTSSLNADRAVVASLVRLAHNFSCDAGFFPCDKTSWEGEWSAWRQHAGEVMLLQKFLTAPSGVLVESFEEADLVVVPGLFQFASSRHMFQKLVRRCPRDFAEELEHLNFMDPTQTPHLFIFADHMNNLRENDPGGLGCYITRHPDNILVSLGTELSSPNHITMPPVVTEAELHPRSSTAEMTRENFLLYSENLDCCHPVRRHLYDVLVSDMGQAFCNSRCIVETISPRSAVKAAGGVDQTKVMQRSVFCPLGPGEVPHRYKFYKAILAGCIPVLFDFPSYFPKQRSWWKEFGSPFQLSLPFFEVIPYTDFVVTVPCTDNYTQSSLDMLWKIRSMSSEDPLLALLQGSVVPSFRFRG
ncbi:KIFC3 [Symbiodinium sp. CCMP2456]|nr:KIFC3 [Symbiodinium sp. CCMP2456]